MQHHNWTEVGRLLVSEYRQRLWDILKNEHSMFAYGRDCKVLTLSIDEFVQLKYANNVELLEEAKVAIEWVRDSRRKQEERVNALDYLFRVICGYHSPEHGSVLPFDPEFVKVCHQIIRTFPEPHK